jgi:hypothetical protein
LSLSGPAAPFSWPAVGPPGPAGDDAAYFANVVAFERPAVDITFSGTLLRFVDFHKTLHLAT